MPKYSKNTETIKNKPQTRPPLTPEAQENEMIVLAMDLARQQLMDGTASSQVITHFLKLGSMKEREERQMVQKQIEHIDAKTKKINSEKNSEEMYERVVAAMKSYNGYGDEYED